MKNVNVLSLVLFLCITINPTQAQTSIKPISDWVKHAPKNNELLQITFEEDYQKLGHASEPWKTTPYALLGEVWINANRFLKLDSLTAGNGKAYTSKVEINDQVAMRLSYGKAELSAVDKRFNYELLLGTARYSPMYILGYMNANQYDLMYDETPDHAIYSMSYGMDEGYILKAFINVKSKQVDKITYLSYDELYGNVVQEFKYSGYKKAGEYPYPTKVDISSINGNISESVKIKEAKLVSNEMLLIEPQKDYAIVEDSESKEMKITTSKYNDYIYFIDMAHTEDRVLLVEFDTYMLVAEAPINTKNGELIVEEVKKLVPNKPIKYFVFGHHHPHYLGGLRAFVHEESTIICTDISEEYVHTIANASHSLQPDILEKEPMPLKTMLVKDSLTLGENEEMIIYFMGEKSAHTKDYLVYYFPKEKLLFQDDLCWIPADGEVKKARARQIGLYNYIESLGLNVETIVQSWPVASNRVKTIIPYKELEESVKLANEK